MDVRPQSNGCKGCAISHEDPEDKLVHKILAQGGILRLKHKWILHHYVGSEGFLGWLALQPYEHREKLSHLSGDEAKGFGEILKAIEEGLYAYWEDEFPEDSLERVYVGCFYEYSKHLHLHIVPRPKSFRQLTVCSAADSPHEQIEKDTRWPHAWHVYLATKCQGFPNKYRREEQKAKRLMDYLKTRLPLA